MAEVKRYYWLRLHDDFFDSLRIKKLRQMAGGDTYTIIYLKMQLKAIRSGGTLTFTGIEKDFASELALDLGENADDVRVTLAFLQSCGLVECSDDINFFLPYAVENTGSETASAQRVREFRQRSKALHCNTDETQVKQLCSAEIEKEKEIEKYNTIVSPNGDTQVTQETASPSLPDCPYTEIMDLYNKICISFPRVIGIDGERKRAVSARWRTYKSLDPFRELFEIAEATLFLKGNNNRNWVANFDWMMKPGNFVKILEHRYDGTQQAQQQAPQTEYDKFMAGLARYCGEDDGGKADNNST